MQNTLSVLAFKIDNNCNTPGNDFKSGAIHYYVSTVNAAWVTTGTFYGGAKKGGIEEKINFF